MQNKFCPSCGQEVKDSGAFCINCGFNLNNTNNAVNTNNNVTDNSHVNNNSEVYNDFNNINPETMTMNNNNNNNNNQNVNYNYNNMNNGQVNKEFTNTSAIVGLILGILSLLCCCSPLFGGIGLGFSINGLNKAKENNGSGKGMAIAGMVTSIICLVGFVLVFILSFIGEVMA